MSDYRCSTCKGQVQASRFEYLSLVDGVFQPPDGSNADFPDYSFYCQNGCFEQSTGGIDDLATPEDFLERLVVMDLIEAGPPE